MKVKKKTLSNPVMNSWKVKLCLSHQNKRGLTLVFSNSDGISFSAKNDQIADLNDGRQRIHMKRPQGSS